MDDIDRAQAQEEMAREFAIANAKGSTLLATGECHNCGASVPDGHRFCDVDCRDDYQRDIARRCREGVRK